MSEAKILRRTVQNGACRKSVEQILSEAQATLNESVEDASVVQSFTVTALSRLEVDEDLLIDELLRYIG